MDEIEVKQDPDDLLDGRHAVFVQENAEAKEENEQKLICCTVCNAILPGSLALFDHLEEHANTMFDDQSDDGMPAANDLGEVGCDLGSISSESETERDTRPEAVSKERSDLPVTTEEVTCFICDYCSTSFHSKWRLIRHLEWDHKLKSSKTTPKRGLQTNSSLHKIICKYCSTSFSTKRNLNRHIERFHLDIILKCHHCSKSFIDKYDLKKHLFYRHKFKVNKTDSRNREKVIQKNATAVSSTINDGRQQHTCQYCNKIFQSNYYLRQHLERKHKLKTKLVPPTKVLYLPREEIETLVCFYCKGRKYQHKKALQGHILKVHDIYLRQISNSIVNSKSYICDICSAKFKTKPSMIEHFQRKHNFKVPNVQSRRFSCELCNLNFSSITKMIQHRKSKEHLGQIKAKNPISCPICFKTFDTLEKLIGHKDQHSLVRCYYCGSKLKSINDMHLHVLNHACLKIDKRTGANSWNCNACEKQFSNKEEFFTHHKSAHPYCRSFRCPECYISLGMGRKTQWGIIQSHLAAHKRGYNGFYCFKCGQLTKKYKEHQRTHIRPYMCDQCAKRFSTKFNLEDHNRIVHLKNEQYLCEVCGKSFPSKVARTQHFNHAHSKIEFTCDICGIKKNRKINFILHMASHQEKVQKPFVCGTCRKGFRLKVLLQRHELTHSGVKPFSCSVCSRAFNQIDSLKRHMRQHTGEEPYKCKDCGKGFKQTSSLKAHIHVHHNPNRKRCEICEKSFRNDVALKKHLEDHVRQGKSKKNAERKTKCSGKEEKKKRYCTRSTNK